LASLKTRHLEIIRAIPSRHPVVYWRFRSGARLVLRWNLPLYYGSHSQLSGSACSRTKV
jgi:hypothetical protein